MLARVGRQLGCHIISCKKLYLASSSSLERLKFRSVFGREATTRFPTLSEESTFRKKSWISADSRST